MAHLIRGLALVALTSGCTPEPVFDQGGLLDATVEQVILPAHARLATASATLDTSTDALCTSPDATSLEAARTAWRDTRQALKGVEAWSFGPYRAIGIEVGKLTDKWPGSQAGVEAILASDDTLDAGYVRALDYRSRTRGLPAVEVLLYTTNADGFTGERGARRCAFLGLLVDDSNNALDAFVRAWDPDGGDFAGEIRTAGAGSRTYAERQTAIGELIGGLIFVTQETAGNRLGLPLGDGSGGTPLPEGVEAPYSDTSIEHALWALDSLDGLYRGAGDNSLGGYVRSRQKAGDVDGLVVEHLDAARAALQAIPGPLESAVVDDPDSVRAAIEAVDLLGVALSGEVSTLLGINPTAVEGDND